MAEKTLVFLTGVLSDHRVWSYQTNHLQDLVQCQTIPLTHGGSTEELIESVLNKVEGPFFLVGHSMGGWLALELARKLPERIAKLCLVNTSAQQDSDEKHRKRIEMIQEVEQGNFQTVAKMLADLYVYDDRFKKEVHSMLLNVGQQTFLTQQKILLARHECLSFLPSLAMPTLIIHARQDKVFSLAVHEELAGKIPNSKLAIIEDSGHMSPMESPQAVTALLRFWLDYF
ncbi:alpha/beta fold hydrolase [Legionella parisiensis]|uniref:Dihydrolipoyllysine-residue acetyltransferase component of acetoin cleaving system n=1 Tax=Legionella parisiensis TaxID=45071 RepID=A0A1E5JN70_9GAMM|nr:alpha/beta hydrolase [Legionella parisiensis]KTD42862.1 lipolytic protein [Legionella parisiensis]OEH45987.1 Dihydrolipoyllysine-residue acetyltransferase component of acetoin cleaving system [Legionella parisiensis]STX78064.1 lipolytic protein [Legionella parisiensis]